METTRLTARPSIGRWTALASALVVALAAVSASTALAQTNEGRGYGGPLTVGPNFSTGGVYSPPVYSKPDKKKPSAKAASPANKAKSQTAKRPKPSTPAATEQVEVKDDAQEAKPANETKAAAETKEPTCTRFDATTGRAIQVPC